MTTPRKLSSRYELGEILGFGGMSEVHLARDLRLSRDVAIKVLRADLARDPTFYLRFRREAQNAAALNHPAIVAVYDTGEAETDGGPLPYIVMEYVEGDTLRDLVRGKGPFPPRRAMEVVADVCAALDFSHKNGIVHRDMKPANIMINSSGAVKVMDFGIARALADAANPMTQTAAVIGTAQYLSPEQARGEQVDARSDVYSVGCVLFEILTSEPPFTGDSPVAVAYQHVREDPRRPSEVHDGVPRELDAVVLKAMSKNPANRYQSAAEMRTDLIRVLGGQKPSAPTVMTDEDRSNIMTNTGTHRHRAIDGGGVGRGRKIAYAAAAVVTAVIIGAFAWVISPYGRASQVVVPDVDNKTSQVAQSTLQNSGFRVEVVQKASSSTTVGNVVGTKPDAGSKAGKGTTVIIEISSGPQQIQVPRLNDLTLDAAKQKLQQYGLAADGSVDRIKSSIAEKDHVVKTEPSAGSTVSADTPIKLIVGAGAQNSPVPGVVGQQVTAAQDALTKAGFKVQLQPTPSNSPKDTVLKQSPQPGQQAGDEATVTLQVSDGSQLEMPDLTGMGVNAAQAKLRSLGWTGNFEQGVQGVLNPGLAGQIAAQSPQAGSTFGKTDTISITVYRFL